MPARALGRAGPRHPDPVPVQPGHQLGVFLLFRRHRRPLRVLPGPAGCPARRHQGASRRVGARTPAFAGVSRAPVQDAGVQSVVIPAPAGIHTVAGGELVLRRRADDRAEVDSFATHRAGAASLSLDPVSARGGGGAPGRATRAGTPTRARVDQSATARRGVRRCAARPRAGSRSPWPRACRRSPASPPGRQRRLVPACRPSARSPSYGPRIEQE